MSLTFLFDLFFGFMVPPRAEPEPATVGVVENARALLRIGEVVGAVKRDRIGFKSLNNGEGRVAAMVGS